jgi:hypothetical protein
MKSQEYLLINCMVLPGTIFDLSHVGRTGYVAVSRSGRRHLELIEVEELLKRNGYGSLEQVEEGFDQ